MLVLIGAGSSVVTILTALLAFFKKFRPWWRKRRADKRAEFSAAVQAAVEPVIETKLQTALLPLQNELHHNGGGSLKDAVVRIEERQKADRVAADNRDKLAVGSLAAVHDKVDGVLERVKGVDSKVDGVVTEVRVLTKRVEVVENTCPIMNGQFPPKS